jgi:hypothetical protein
MKTFHYKIEDDEVQESTGEVREIPPDFIEYHNSLGPEKIYYKLSDGKVTDVISEGGHEDLARMRADDFLSALNVNLL